MGNGVRYDHGRRRWLTWDKHRWRPDENAGIQRLWLDVLKIRFQQAVMAAGLDKPRLLAEVQRAAARNAEISGGLTIAASLNPIATAGDDWDRDPWVLGCANGVVDLRTGRLRPGKPEDLISRSTGLPFDSLAVCPRWQQFLAEVFAGDSQLVEWYGRLVGASLIGLSKEVVAIYYGLGNNGKSVAMQTLRNVAGDYAVVIPIETLVDAKRSAGEATPDLMQLRGARLAFSSEPDRAAKLRGGVLKRLTSIDRMTGRHLYGRTETWAPTHTLHVATNHLPSAEDATEGFWRRVALIAWPVQFRKPGGDGDGPLEDPNLVATLEAEASGILAWAVRGAVAFAAGRLLYPYPAAVQAGTDSYRRDEDPLAEFIRRRVVYERGAFVTTAMLYMAYQGWCDEAAVAGIERLSLNRFARAFAERGRGVERKRDATNRAAFAHVRLRGEGDPDDPEDQRHPDGSRT